MNFRAFTQLLLARLRELKREPEVIFWVFFFPVLLAIALGVAFRDRPPDKVYIAVVEHPQAQQMALALNAHPTLKAEVIRAEDAARQFRLGKVAGVLSAGATENAYELRYDPSRPDSLLARSLVDSALQKAAGRQDPVAVREEPVSQPGARYIDFLIPGLLGMNLMSGGMWGVGFAVVDMRVKRLLKRLIATPMRRSDFLMALISSRIALMLIEVVLLLMVGRLVFHMVVQGSLSAIVAVAATGSLCFAGLGLLVASRARKIETVSGLMNLVMLPMFVLSGVFFSADRFPDYVQPIIRALPLTALNDGLRAVILEGASLPSQSARLLLLALWGGLSFVFALRWFRWQ
ncbi:MAG: ABC transporter permease [Burkholderiales bacterium]